MSGRVAVVGAGPGGLTTAMILASKGLKVTVFEKAGQVGGRNAHLQVGNTKHDIGPTMLMMKFVLDAVFKDTNRKSEDYIKFQKLDPMYRLSFADDKFLDCYSSDKKDQMIKEFDRVFPEDAKSYDKWLEFEMKRYKYTMPLLQKIYDGYPSLINKDSIKALPYLSLGRSIFGVLGDNFKNPLTKLSFSFQSKYLGMTPWECPGFFNLIPFVEHAFGVYHVEGGLSTISEQMAKVIREAGGEIRLNTGVKQLIIENGRDVKGLITENGEEFRADNVVLNADFGYAMSKLIPDADKILSKWAPSNLPKKNYSCSTYMMYLAMDKLYDQVPHHTIVFSDDYKGNMDAISNGKVPDDPSIYVRNASVNDPTLAPAGKSGVYVLVPVPNIVKQGEEGARAFWNDEKTQSQYRQKVIKIMEKRLGMKDFESHIEAEQVITPTMWQEQRNVYKGAVFSLAHNFFQLLLWRPRNKFEELENLFIVGAGTHPGSGLPTIYESGRMASEMILKRNGIPFERSGYVDVLDQYKIL